MAGQNAVLAVSDTSFSNNNAATLDAGAIGLIRNVQRKYCSLWHVPCDDNKISALSESSSLVTYLSSFRAAVVLQDSLLQGNMAGRRGGAIAVYGTCTLTIQGSTLTNNSVPTGSGDAGAICAAEQSKLAISHTSISNNRAFAGGGITLYGNANMLLGANVTVSNNTAKYTGGGLTTTSRNFDLRAVLRAMVNNTANYDQNIAVATERIAIVNGTREVNVTSRLGDSTDGLVEAQVRTSGMYDLPSVFEVQAVLEGSVVDMATPTPDGVATFKIAIHKPAGRYNITFRPLDTPAGMLQTYLTVNVFSCPVGDVTVSSGDACQTCVRGFYSFNPANDTCDQCPRYAGEASLVMPHQLHADVKETELCFTQRRHFLLLLQSVRLGMVTHVCLALNYSVVCLLDPLGTNYIKCRWSSINYCDTLAATQCIMGIVTASYAHTVVQ